MKPLFVALALSINVALLTAAANSDERHSDRSGIVSTARGFFFIGATSARVTDVISAGDVAVAAFRDDRVGKDNWNGELLLKRFGFGWQIIDLAVKSQFQPSELLNHGISRRTTMRLLGLRHLTTAGAKLKVSNDLRDVGDRADVEAIRKLLQNRHDVVPTVMIGSGHGLAELTNIYSNGEAIFVNQNAKWKMIGAGGGCLRAADLAGYGFPSRMAKRYGCGKLVKSHTER